MTELGPFPLDWEVSRLGELFGIQQGKSLSPKSRTRKSPRPFLRTANVLWGRVDLSTVDEMDFSDEEVARLRLMPGDLLVCEGGEVGRTAMWEGGIDPCCYQNHIHRLRASVPQVESRFFMYWMQAAMLLLGMYRAEGNVTTIPNLSKSRLSRFAVPVPPFSEQKKIAAVLSAVQEAKEKTEAVIRAAKELKKSLMKHLFSYGPVDVEDAEKVPLKETEIGEVPRHWEVVEVGGLGEIVTGTTPSTKVAEYYGGRFMFTSPGDIGDTKYVMTTEKHLTEKGLGVSRPLPKDTVLVVCIGATIGKTAMTWAERSTTNQQINAVVPGDDVRPDYLFYALAYRAPHLPSMAGRAAVPIVNKSNFAKFVVPLPAVSEQKKIAQVLSAVDEHVELEQDRKRGLEQLFRTLLNDLMTGKIRVKDLEVSA